MKRIVLFLTLCLALIGQAHAQRYLPGQRGLQFTASAVDGFHLEKGDKQAFSGGIALSTYTKGGNRWVFGETVNWGESLLFDGSTITDDDNFLYGGAVTFEIETYLSDRIVLLLNVRERILGGSSINLFHTQISAGLKFIIN